MLVRVKGKGVKLNGTWKYKNEEAEINEEEYEANKEYVDIIKEDATEPEIPQIPANNDKDDEEIELQKLKEKAKELGIRNAHLMGKTKLEEAIAEKEAELLNAGQEGSEQTETNSEVTGINVGDNAEGDKTGEGNPQE